MAREVPDVRLPGMNRTISSRRRPTDTVREADRLCRSIASALGPTVRTGRVRLRLTQAELAERTGVHESWISRIELGRGRGAALETWIAIGVALGQPLAVSFSRPLDAFRGPTDSGHLAMQELLLSLAREAGRSCHLRTADTPCGPIEVDRRLRSRRSQSGPDHRRGVEHLRRCGCSRPEHRTQTRRSNGSGGDHRQRHALPRRIRVGRPAERDEPEPAGALSRNLRRGVFGVIAAAG